MKNLLDKDYREEYYKQRKLCPKCKTNKFFQTDFVFIGFYDNNPVTCFCGYRGYVHNLIPYKPASKAPLKLKFHIKKPSLFNTKNPNNTDSHQEYSVKDVFIRDLTNAILEEKEFVHEEYFSRDKELHIIIEGIKSFVMIIPYYIESDELVEIVYRRVIEEINI